MIWLTKFIYSCSFASDDERRLVFQETYLDLAREALIWRFGEKNVSKSSKNEY